jgi:hypothetical protein
MKTAVYAIMIAVSLLAGCATPMPTASGRPETTITGQSSDAIRAALVNRFLNDGWNIKNGDTMMLTMEKDAGLAAGMFLGSAFNPTVMKRIRFNIVPQEAGTFRVVAGAGMITNPGSGFEKENPMEGKAYRQLQTILEDTKFQLMNKVAAVPKP